MVKNHAALLFCYGITLQAGCRGQARFRERESLRGIPRQEPEFPRQGLPQPEFPLRESLLPELP